ncbi:hypothetical protein pEaSNUABM9_00289 [Erwinia phage pEa_SNUABM_9]|nr:hypothetical protein pEaSNUABM9_00289 [Erwinia phage pEa_SNUABM_9]
MLTIDILDKDGKVLFDVDVNVNGKEVHDFAMQCDRYETLMIGKKKCVRYSTVKKELDALLNMKYSQHILPRLHSLDPHFTFITHDYYR